MGHNELNCILNTDTNLSTWEIFNKSGPWTANVTTVTADQDKNGQLVMAPWRCESEIIDPKNVVTEMVWRNNANKLQNLLQNKLQLIEHARM